MNLHAALADVDQEGVLGLAAFAVQGDGDFEAGAMIAETAVENHAARGGECTHGLFDGDGFFEGEQSAAVFEIPRVLLAAHDHEWDGARIFHGLQFVQKLGTAVQIAVHDESVDF